MGFLSSLFGKKSTRATTERVSAPEGSDRNTSALEALEPFRRTCWLPILENGDGDIKASKFAGIPYLAPDEEWPECPNCKNPIQLFLQLNSEDLPVESGKPWGDGLLQFFYCTSLKPNCAVACGSWDEFSKTTLLRVITDGDAVSKFSESPVKEAFPPKVVVDWRTSEDFPMFWTEVEAPVLYEAEAEELMETCPLSGEKLLGWPLWVQDKEYPNCPECNAEMKLVFQVDSNGALPYMFGDAGVGHITQCPEHRTILAFRWACS